MTQFLWGSGGLCRKGWKVEFQRLIFLGKESACSNETVAEN